MNMLEKAIVSVRGTDIEPVLRCEVDMGFGADLRGSVPADYMTCDEEEVRGVPDARQFPIFFVFSLLTIFCSDFVVLCMRVCVCACACFC